MKKQTLLYSIILIVLSSHAQEQFTHTATKQNISCNYDCTILDVADLNNNPEAIIWVTPILEKGLNLNPHPIGVYYFGKKWNIFNLDQKPIPADTKFNVEYVARPDNEHFQYTITTENLRKDGSAFIEHAALNNNSSVKFLLFASWNPEVQKGITNRDSINIQYNKEAGKWSISNINKNPLFARVVYNITISAPGNVNTIAVIPNPLISNSTLISSTATSPSNGVTVMYMTAWTGGIQLPGTSSNSNYQGKTEIIDFLMAANRLYDLATGFPSGKKLYEPITLKIEMGYPITIPLFNAFASGQSNMIFIIETFAINKSTGAEQLNYTIKLTNATIVSFKQAMNKDGMMTSKSKYLDEIKITFGQIEFIKDGKSVLGKQTTTE